LQSPSIFGVYSFVPHCGGEAGEPVPKVDPEDVKAVWQVGREIERRHPPNTGGLTAYAVGVRVFQAACKPGANIGPVSESVSGGAVGSWDAQFGLKVGLFLTSTPSFNMVPAANVSIGGSASAGRAQFSGFYGDSNVSVRPTAF